MGSSLDRQFRPLPTKVSLRSLKEFIVTCVDLSSLLQEVGHYILLHFVTFINEASPWVTVYPVRAKSKGLECFQKFLCHAGRKTGKTVKPLQSDGGV